MGEDSVGPISAEDKFYQEASAAMLKVLGISVVLVVAAVVIQFLFG